jgi:hypothetical protein
MKASKYGSLNPRTFTDWRLTGCACAYIRGLFFVDDAPSLDLFLLGYAAAQRIVEARP